MISLSNKCPQSSSHLIYYKKMERNERQSQKKNIRQKNYAQLFTPPELTSSRAGKQVGRKQTLIKHIYNRMNYF